MEIDFAIRHLQSKSIKSKNEWKYAKAVIITKQRQRLREKHIELTLTVPYCK